MAIETGVYQPQEGGPTYYFGSADNPFNFFDVEPAQITPEQAKIIADGGKVNVITKPAYSDRRAAIESQNKALSEAIRRRGRLLLEL